jgi:hypothetical protein
MVQSRNKEKAMAVRLLRKWIRTHGIYTTTVVLNEFEASTHKAWTKPGALKVLWLHSRKDAVAKQQFSKVTDLFGRRVAVRYYR